MRPQLILVYACGETYILCWVAWDHFQRRTDEVLQAHDENHNSKDKLQKVLQSKVPSNLRSSAPVKEEGYYTNMQLLKMRPEHRWRAMATSAV